jgi:iron-sulfur cluster assembly protein
MITISERALEHVIELMMLEGIKPDTHHLRVGVVGGGCSGLEYKMEFDDKINPGDEVFDNQSIKIVCDKKSILYLFGTELTYSDGLNGRGFEWVNPNANRTCSCGSSFSL